MAPTPTLATPAPSPPAPLHRYNAQLPPSFRGKLADERLLQLHALRTLANHILEAGVEASIEADDNHLAAEKEGAYSRAIERDLSAFEKGICRYLDLKYQIPADDYQLFTQLLLRGAATYEIDMGLRSKLARAVSRIIRKRECKLPHGIPFRPLLDILKRVHLDSVEGGPFIGRDVRDAHCRNILSLLQRCRDYVPEEDSADIIYSELGPKITISSPDAAFEHLLILAHVLPTRGAATLGWLPDALQKFPALANAPEWDAAWLGLFSRVAKHQPCLVDWTPHLPHMYARIVSAFKLPLGSAAPQHPVERRCPHHCVFMLSDRTIPAAAILAAYALSPRTPAAMHHLERLIALVANFFHPSNGGRWTGNLGSFLHSFTVSLASRVTAERAATAAGVSARVIGTQHIAAVAPEEDRITPDMVNRLVSLLLPLVQHGLHSKSNSMTIQAASASRDLAILAPELVVEPLLAVAAECLESLSSPHRTSAALKMLAALTPVFLDPELCPGGAAALPQALTLTLPGIDPNDPAKTESSLRFIAGAAARIQSMMASGDPSASELSYFVEDYAHQLLERVFPLLDTLEAPPKKARNGAVPSNASPQLSSFIFAVSMDNLFAAVPASVAVAAAERVVRHITGSASLNALKFYGALVRSVARAAAASSENGSSAYIFIPKLLDQLLVDATPDLPEEEMELAPLAEDELVWRLRMLAQACRACGRGLDIYASRIAALVSLSFGRSERRVYKAGGRLLRGLLEGLTAAQTVLRGTDDAPAASDVGGGGDTLGREPHVMDDDDDGEDEVGESTWTVKWTVPTESDWRLGESLLRRFIAEGEKLGRLPNGEISIDRDVLFRVLRMMHAVQRGGRWIMAGVTPARFLLLDRYTENKTDWNLEGMNKSDALLALRRPVYAGLGGEREDETSSMTATELWSKVYSFVSDIISNVISARPDDGALLYRCLEPIELAHEPFRRSNQGRLAAHACRGYKAAYRPVIATKRPHDAAGGVGRAMPRFIFKLRIEAQQEVRLYHAARGGMDDDDLFEKIMTQTADLSINAFPRVRGEARGVLTRAWRVARPMSRRREIERVIDVLDAAATATELAHKRKAAEQIDRSMADSAAVFGESSIAEAPDGVTSKEVDAEYETLIGAASVLRSAAAAPIIMRDWDLFDRVTRVLLKAIVAAERPDAGAAVGGLFAKLSGLVRPLSIRPFTLVGNSLEPCNRKELDVLSDDSTSPAKLAKFNELNQHLIGMLAGPAIERMSDDDVENDVDDGGKAGLGRFAESVGEPSVVATERAGAHWRLQSLVATVLTICLREDTAPPPEVAHFFAESMVSDVVSLRHIATRGIALILAMHGGKFSPDGTHFIPGSNPALNAIQLVLQRPGFGKLMVHTLALDHDDGLGGDGSSGGTSSRSFGISNFSRYVDGDACWSTMSGRPWPASWVTRSRDTFNIVQVRLYEAFCRTYGSLALSIFGDTLDKLISSADRKEERIIDGVHDDNIRVISGELAAGITRGLSSARDVCNEEDESRVLQWVEKLLNGFTGPQGSINGGSLVRLVVSAGRGSVGSSISTRLAESIISERPIVVSMDQGSVAHLQARRLRYVHACVADLDPDDGQLAVHVTDAVLQDLTSDIAFGHELKNVREEVARLLSLLATFTCERALSIFAKGVESVAKRQSGLHSEEVAVVGNPDGADGGESIGETLKKYKSRQGETLSRWISIVYWNGDALGFSRYLPVLMPAIVASLDEESDQDRVSHARLALSLAAQGALRPDCMSQVVATCQEIAKSPRYRIRGALLPFIQVLSFSILFTANDDAIDKLRAIVIELLSDPQLEVREVAGATFVTFIRDAPEKVISSIRENTLGVLRKTTKRAPRRGRGPLLSPEELSKRHGAVLSLGSMIMSAPYDIPPWMPSVLVALTDCINDPPPISTSTKTIFADFMRTHRDEWQAHKLAFSEDELERVSDLMVSPSYYA